NTTIDGTVDRISEKMNYPFSGKVTFHIEPSTSKEFDLMLRNTSWSKNTKVTAAGARIKKENGIIIIIKKWHTNDKVEHRFENNIKVKRFINNDLYVKRGALIYALPIEAEKTPTETFEGGFANYDITPSTPAEAERYSNYKMLNITDINRNLISKNFSYEP